MVQSVYSLRSPEQVAEEYGGNKQKIAQAIQLGVLDPTTGALAGMFIDRMRSAQVAEQAPQQTVAQQIFQPAAPPPMAAAPGAPAVAPQAPGGVAALPRAGVPAPQGAMPPQSPAQMQPTQHMAQGGMVAFGDGGMVPGTVSDGAGGVAALPIPDDMFKETDSNQFAQGGIVAFGGGGDVEHFADAGLANQSAITPDMFEQARARLKASRNVAPAPAMVKPAPGPVASPNPNSFDAWRNAIIAQESRGDYGAHNPSGAMGKYQVMPATAKALAARVGVPYSPDLMVSDTPEGHAYQEKIGYAAQQEAWQNAGGNPSKASAYYVGGPKRMNNPNAYTNAYVTDVNARLNAANPAAGAAPFIGANAGAAASAGLAGAQGLQGLIPRLPRNIVDPVAYLKSLGIDPSQQNLDTLRAQMANTTPRSQEWSNQALAEIKNRLSSEGQKTQKDQALWSALADVGATLGTTRGNFMAGLAAALGQGGKDAAQANKDMQAQRMADIQSAIGLENANNAYELGLTKDSYGNLRDVRGNIVTAADTASARAGQQQQVLGQAAGTGYSGQVQLAGSSISQADAQLKMQMQQQAALQAVRNRATQLAQADRAKEAQNALIQNKTLGTAEGFNARVQQYIDHMTPLATANPMMDISSYTPGQPAAPSVNISGAQGNTDGWGQATANP